MLALAWHPSPAFASERIRVALFSDLTSVTVSGATRLILTAPDGESVEVSRFPLNILPGPEGLIVQNRPAGMEELTVSSPDGAIRINDLTVGGTIQIRLQRDRLRVINELDIEEYLGGVVPAEMNANWNSEALKVQAIIARTYALYQRQANLDKDYDLTATTADQVYWGKAKEHPAANRAIAETAGWVLTYEGKLILSAYHSTSAGPTENASTVWGLDLPYLKGVSCPFDQNSPYYQWAKALPMEGVQERFNQSGYALGTIVSIAPLDWTSAGRVDRLRILHSDGELILRASDLRKILGYTELPSTRFAIQRMDRELHVEGHGAGHAVGLCQWGAKEMADMGYDYEKILKYYYPGVLLEHASAFLDTGQDP